MIFHSSKKFLFFLDKMSKKRKYDDGSKSEVSDSLIPSIEKDIEVYPGLIDIKSEPFCMICLHSGKQKNTKFLKCKQCEFYFHLSCAAKLKHALPLQNQDILKNEEDFKCPKCLVKSETPICGLCFKNVEETTLVDKCQHYECQPHGKFH